MAERRMFAKTIIDSDAFIDMPLSTQALYFHLSMRGDDDGFINNPKKIQRMIGSSDDDLKLLVAKRFIIPFESGIVVIKHWKIHNYIRGDRKKDTVYPEEMALLVEKKNGSYSLKSEEPIHLTDKCQADDGQVTDKCPHRLVEDRIGEAREREVNLICSKEGATKNETASSDEIKHFHGSVRLSENQITLLIDTMGLSSFDDYVYRLDDFIKKNNAKIDDHFSMILKWYNEDKE